MLPADAGLCADAALSSLPPKPHVLMLMTWSACWADIGQADCGPHWWCPHADFAPALRPAEFLYDPVTNMAARIFPFSSIAARFHIRNPFLMKQDLLEAGYMYTYQVISSPMLLYRLRCLFPSCEVKKFKDDLSVWNVSLRHKRTHYQADFEDNRGGVIGGADPSMKEDTAATQDLLGLIELLCSARCPHTYDGLVAGCVA